MSRSFQTQRDDKGAVALEMVLALPVLIFLITAAFVVGINLSKNAETVALAHKGARAAALGRGLPENTIIISGNCSSPPDPDDGDVTVLATLPVPLQSIPPFLPNVFDDNFTAEATVRCGG